jgi:hydrogenase nickel incorporation protein HypA/HybF
MVVTVLKELERYDKLEKVEELVLEVGELTFLNPEQLKFGFGIASKETILAESELTVIPIKAIVKCKQCDYVGQLDYGDEEEGWHSRLPVFACPECGSGVDVATGKDCTVKNIRLVIDDEEGE